MYTKWWIIPLIIQILITAIAACVVFVFIRDKEILLAVLYGIIFEVMPIPLWFYSKA